MSRRNRQIESLNNKHEKNETAIHNLEKSVQRLQKKYDDHIIHHILDDLNAERFPGSGKPLYTYEDIANRYDTSASTIQRIAQENGLSRRSKKLC